ncbi:D-alanine--D-alanine ligase [Rickettsiales bacterium]|nr:D-alanine--D-alanine ligase [Rickettsiales bacterium]
MSNNKPHIAVLMGGLSSEREVSLMTGKAVVKALEEMNYNFTAIDVGENIAEELLRIKPDVAFIALHGTYGEDGCIQGLLEILKIPYTHSKVAASAICMNKEFTKNIVEKADILCPPSVIMTASQLHKCEPISRPFVIKPVDEGSSVGIFIIKDGDSLPSIEELSKYGTLMIEKYIAGKELSVAVSDDEPFGVIELRPKTGFYDYKNKYVDNMTEHFVPAPIPEDIYKLAMDNAYKAHKVLGCSGISRSDFRYDCDGDGKLYFLETNTHPGCTELSIAPELAAFKGISFSELVDYLLARASCQK